jgi:parallel beta-helix repeat protein
MISILLGVVLTATAAQVTINPGDDIQAKVNSYPTGTTFNVKAGLYRSQSVTPKDWDVFIGEPGAIMNGSILLTNFVKQGSLWVATAAVSQGQWIDYGTYPGWEGSKDPDDLFYNDVPLQHVLSQGEVTTGKWYVIYGQPGTIYVADDPAGKKVEISVTRCAFSGSASNVAIQGFVVEKYAIPGQFGAIGDQFQGANWLIQGNEARLNHGTGISGANGSRIIGNYVHHNGMKGIGNANLGPGIPAAGLLVEGNEMAFNSTMHFVYDGESGGAKFGAVDGLVCRNNYSHDNTGWGLWTDVDSINVTYDGNLVVSNSWIGIQHEISYAATIRNNYCVGNGWRNAGWAWDEQILIFNSQDVQAYSNTIVMSGSIGNGIVIMHGNRGSGGYAATYGPYVARNNYIHNNNIIHTTTHGASGIDCSYDNANFWATSSNRFDYNIYTVANSGNSYWWWNDSARTFSGLQGCGQELHGTLNAPIATQIIGLSGNLNFGTVATGTTATATMTISNSGNTPFMITGISYPAGFSGARWGIVPAGGTTNVTVTFAPSTSTNYGGTITVMTDANGANTISVSASAGVVINPGDNIQAAVDANPTGTTFRMTAGVYSNQMVYPKEADAFIGDLGPNGERVVTMTGARTLTSFVFSNGLYAVTNQMQKGQTREDLIWACTSWPGAIYCEDLYFDSKPLIHVTNKADVVSGKWYFDYDNHTIYFADDPSGHLVETSVTRSSFLCQYNNGQQGLVNNVTIKNIIVEKYAICLQFAAIGDQFPGYGWTIENCEARLNHSVGILVWGPGSQALNNFVHHNGLAGIDSMGTDTLIQGNEISYNNFCDVSRNFTGGGGKMAWSDGGVWRNNYSHHNNGMGMWTDINNINILYEGNVVEENVNVGIMHEISYKAEIRDNHIRRNGGLSWLWEGQILISNSREVSIHDNYLETGESTNGCGFSLINGNRSGDPMLNGVIHTTVNVLVYSNRVNHLHRAGDNGQGAFWATSGMIGTDQNGQGPYDSASSNVFNFNNYHVINTGDPHWLSEGPMNWTTWQNTAGQDRASTVDTSIRGDIADGTYVLTAQISGMALDVENGLTNNGTMTVQSVNAGASGQLWRVVSVGGSYYKLVHVASGRCLDVNGGSTNAGARVQLHDDNSSSAQQWKIEWMPGGWYRLTCRASGRVLEVSGASKAAGAQIWQGYGNNVDAAGNNYGCMKPSQMWNFAGSGTSIAQSPYGGAARSVPGQIEAEDYDNGGEGVAYHDSDATNNGDATLRNDGVDIKDAGSGNYVIGWNAPGEWREYTVNIPNGACNISSLVATVNTDAQQRVLLGDGPEGSNFVVLGVMNIPNTGSYSTFQQGVLANVAVTNGGNGKILRLETLGNYFDVDGIRFDSVPGSLSGSGAVGATSTVDLTAGGADDWAHWGFNGTNIDHKAVSGNAVNHITETHVGSLQQYGNNANGYTWSDGTPTANAVATTTGIYIVGTGNSFTITVPADTTSRTLKLYVGGWMSAGTLTAHLSDGSAVDYTDSSFSNNGASYYAVYTITYKAGAANQNMTVRWQMASGAAGGNVTLQAATLSGGGIVTPPAISIAHKSGQAGMIELSWLSVAGTAYAVYKTTNLLAGWPAQPFTNNISGDGTTNVFSETIGGDHAAYYRVKAASGS